LPRGGSSSLGKRCYSIEPSEHDDIGTPGQRRRAYRTSGAVASAPGGPNQSPRTVARTTPFQVEVARSLHARLASGCLEPSTVAGQCHRRSPHACTSIARRH